ncbi:MAG: hypothetical protein KGJ33_01780, partial [Patescibacteria group bacterium]|nr:hypothetical protein [Patescibacteria group bacterium]
TQGILVKTAGYAGGITSVTPFGTITFTAKKSGTGTVSFGADSQAFLKTGKISITGAAASVTIGPTVVVPAKAALTSSHNQSPTPQATPDMSPVTTQNGVVITPTPSPVIGSQVAAVGAATSTGGGSMTLWIIVAILVVAVVIYMIMRMGRKKTM